jgi:hypothetical protein
VKTCSRCGISKPLSDFHRLAKSPDGYRGACKACRQEESKVNHIKNRERINKNSSAWRRDNRERFLAGLRDWARRYPDRVVADGRRYRQVNREKLRQKAREPHRREHHRMNAKWQRAKRELAKGSTSSPITHEQWCQLQDEYVGMCIYCYARPERLTMDHLDSLKNGGSHNLDNVAPACRGCNCSKQSKSFVMYLHYRGAA